MPVAQLAAGLRATYCGAVGYETMHITDKKRKDWLVARIEAPLADALEAGHADAGDLAAAARARARPPLAQRVNLLDRLTWSVLFEEFLATKFGPEKRFGLEGAETLIPGMKALLDTASRLGVDTAVMGMPHRGRLSVMANVLRKPLPQIFSEFHGTNMPDTAGGSSFIGSGDVKYHLGTSVDRPTLAGKEIRISLLANPSHLEAVAPVVQGKARAKQHFLGDTDRSKVMTVLLHGDGSHSGQGVVYETYDLTALPDYTVGGSIHIVVNNQVAFTTDPKSSRSSRYCTDVAKAVDAPIFHVNGDDAEAVQRVMELAAEYRQRFKSDVVVDLVSYRKHGHNEIDEPMFTQPLMYSKIKAHPDPLQIYSQKLIADGSVASADAAAMAERIQGELQVAFEEGKHYEAKPSHWLASHWEGFKGPDQQARIKNTGVPMETLKEVGALITALPEGFAPHRQVKKVYDARRKMVETGEGVDWGMAEALAFGTLVAEGNHVRLSGQDVERGTFSHRHSIVHDQKTGERYMPLAAACPAGARQAQCHINNSSLSEYGVLGFELGYSLENPNSLVIWEAQFGDFANCAQPVFDQFLSSGENKWLRQTGLVCLLPHGYDGQGPEHSSARIERFLQMTDEDPFEIAPEALTPDSETFFDGKHLGNQIQTANWQIVNCTTPAQYFHLLRRQVHREFRKPLIVFSPKMLLRYPKCKDHLEHFDDDDQNDIYGHVRFKRLIMDDSQRDRSAFPAECPDVKRLLICSGQVYFKLNEERLKRDLQDAVHMVRVEQLSPFPYDLTLRELRRYPNAEVMWLQEEPKNMGAYLYAMPRIEACCRVLGRPIRGHLPYAGRPAAASPSTGFKAQHKLEEAEIVRQALTL